VRERNRFSIFPLLGVCYIISMTSCMHNGVTSAVIALPVRCIGRNNGVIGGFEGGSSLPLQGSRQCVGKKQLDPILGGKTYLGFLYGFCT